MGADLLVTDQNCQKSFSVQVKTNSSKASFFLLGKKSKDMISETHIYVLVDIREVKSSCHHTEQITYFIIGSEDLSGRAYFEGDWPSVNISALQDCKSSWGVFGSPT